MKIKQIYPRISENPVYVLHGLACRSPYKSNLDGTIMNDFICLKVASKTAFKVILIVKFAN